MDIKKLSKTMQSLEELNSVLAEFETTLKNKKNAIAQQRQSYKNNMAQKNEQIEETLRLLYVGITRAKKELYFTSAKKYVILIRINNF